MQYTAETIIKRQWELIRMGVLNSLAVCVRAGDGSHLSDEDMTSFTGHVMEAVVKNWQENPTAPYVTIVSDHDTEDGKKGKFYLVVTRTAHVSPCFQTEEAANIWKDRCKEFVVGILERRNLTEEQVFGFGSPML